ncbi:hypothetical protein LCGC14_1428300 [marine sediment metagenome]|uniref:Uncharacterized protein n=1 Tax=marine sediment metagenome TaxID=412755 RepID=A0A0F9JPP0_9ZZZZ
MPKKIKVKPTPSQARILRALRDYSIPETPLYIYRGGWKPYYGGGEYKGPKTANLEAPPLKQSMKALEREGWIEQRENDKSHFPTNNWVLSYYGLEVVNGLDGDDFETPAPLWTAKEVLDVLEKRHQPPEWIFIRELRIGTGYTGRAWNSKQGVYIDGFALNCYPSKSMQRIAYEVKVGRGDFLKEIKTPEKREPFMRYANQFFFVTPVGLVKPHEIPDEVGLIEIHGDGFWKIKVKAPYRRTERPGWPLVASIARSLSADYLEFRSNFR